MGRHIFIIRHVSIFSINYLLRGLYLGLSTRPTFYIDICDFSISLPPQHRFSQSKVVRGVRVVQRRSDGRRQRRQQQVPLLGHHGLDGLDGLGPGLRLECCRKHGRLEVWHALQQRGVDLVVLVALVDVGKRPGPSDYQQQRLAQGDLLRRVGVAEKTRGAKSVSPNVRLLTIGHGKIHVCM